MTTARKAAMRKAHARREDNRRPAESERLSTIRKRAKADAQPAPFFADEEGAATFEGDA
jgi:hypothetical protein